jgi:hypothetical protein
MMRGGMMEDVDIYLRDARAAAIRLNPDNTAKVNRMNKGELLEWATTKKGGATREVAAGGTVGDFQMIIDILSPAPAAPAAAAPPPAYEDPAAAAARRDEEEMAQAIAASLAAPAPAPAPAAEAEYDAVAEAEMAAAIAASLLTHPAASASAARSPLDQVVDMGFTDLDARAALDANQGGVQGAVNWLGEGNTAASAAAAAAAAAAAPEPAPAAAGKPRIKVLLTDLDNTLLTNIVKVAAPNYKHFDIVPVAEAKFTQDPTTPPDLDVITTNPILQFLNRVSNDDDILWFIVSSGDNINKLNDLIKYAREKMGFNLKYNNSPGTYLSDYAFGLKDRYISKPEAVTAILDNLSETYEIEKALFIDDEEHHHKAVTALNRPGLTSRGVPVNHYKIMPPTLDFTHVPTMITPADIKAASVFLFN